MDLKDKIRSIEDYPQKGVIFRDITTLLKDAEGLKGRCGCHNGKPCGCFL